MCLNLPVTFTVVSLFNPVEEFLELANRSMHVSLLNLVYLLQVLQWPKKKKEEDVHELHSF